MKKLLMSVLTAATVFCGSVASKAANPSPEAEMRSTWIATVFSIDWPRTAPGDGGSAIRVSSTGNQKDINRQKEKLAELLDSLAINNFNSAKLQVRSRCDAMYKSSYEPWSSDLVSKRGMDPGYDPLEFFVEECHKRGLEAHAWINPYRYETAIGSFTGTPKAYRDEHPDWLIDVGAVSYLNPALPEVRQRICDVAAEIVSNYDVDGLLFDDYFYPQGVDQEDAAQYKAYTDGGGKLNIGDWRRANINQMVREVYATVKKIKPWVRFGIGPAGITCTDIAHANSHNVPRCTSGSDYQYKGIFSDPLAWLEDKALDYISPQIYWGIGYDKGDFDILSKWWSDRMPTYKRHLFISKDISSLSKTGDWSDVPPIQYASGPGVTTFDQYRRQIEMTREYSTDGEPGSVFYSAKFIYSASPLFGHFLRTNVYSRKALLPSMQWIPAVPQALVEGLSLNGSTLSWTPVEGMRYAVFGHNGSDREVLGFTYGTAMEIPAEYAANGKVSVGIYDRYGNVYSLRTLGASVSSIGTPAISTPANGETIGTPFDIVWSEVSGAESYILEIATDNTMNDLIETRRVHGATTINSNDLENLRYNKPLFARIRALADNAQSTPSVPIEFNAFKPEITSPANDSITDNLTPTITWTSINGEALIEVAEDAGFKNMICSETGQKGSYTIEPYKLQSHKYYWVRATTERDGYTSTSDPIRFKTPGVEETVPTVANPVHEGVLFADGNIAIKALEGMKTARLEIAASESFPSRSLYICNLNTGQFNDPKEGSEIKIGSKKLVDGTTYYARARATYNTADGSTVNTEYSPAISFTYSDKRSNGVDDVKADSETLSAIVDGNTIRVSGISGDTVTITDTAGHSVSLSATGKSEVIFARPSTGIYLVSDGHSTFKVIVR